jgi:hypothetical protein
MSVYRIESVVNDGGDLAGNILRTSVAGAMVKYADELRENMLTAKFPDKWQWHGKNKKSPRFDFPPSMSFGYVMGKQVFCYVEKEFDRFYSIKNEFIVKDAEFIWFDVPIVMADRGDLPHIFVTKPGYRLHCSSEFRDFWIKNGFAGISFSLVEKKAQK